MSAPPFQEPPPAYPGATYQSAPPQPTGAWYPPPTQPNFYQQGQVQQQYGAYTGGTMPGYPNQQQYPAAGYYGGQQGAPYPQQPGYSPQQPYAGGFQQPHSVVVVKEQPRNTGPSTGDCCLMALCALCCACCLADALD